MQDEQMVPSAKTKVRRKGNGIRSKHTDLLLSKKYVVEWCPRGLPYLYLVECQTSAKPSILRAGRYEFLEEMLPVTDEILIDIFLFLIIYNNNLLTYSAHVTSNMPTRVLQEKNAVLHLTTCKYLQ